MTQRVFSADHKQQLLRTLTDKAATMPSNIDVEAAATWLRDHALAGLGVVKLRDRMPEMVDQLELDYFIITAENSVHKTVFEAVIEVLESAEITPVVFKGFALLHNTYHDFAARTMNDVDLWIHPSQMTQAASQLDAAGFIRGEENTERPDELQELAFGEIHFVSEQFPNNLIELQYAPFNGWWLNRTSALDIEAVWQECQPLQIGEHRVGQLCNEHAMIHLAVHNVINHQLSLYALRAFIDSVLFQQEQKINWSQLVRDAKKWRVSTVVWLHLWLTTATVGLPEDVQTYLAQLRPPRWQQQLISRFVTSEMMLDHLNLAQGKRRFLFLLSVTDRKRDALNFFFRAFWPEKSWLNARYGSLRRWHHLWQAVRFGRI